MKNVTTIKNLFLLDFILQRLLHSFKIMTEANCPYATPKKALSIFLASLFWIINTQQGMINHHESNIADKIQEHTDFFSVIRFRRPPLQL